MSKKFDDKKNIIIVGGGHGAVTVIKNIKDKIDRTKYDIVVISARPYHIVLPALLRVQVSNVDDLDNRAFIPFDNLPVIFKQGIVTSINEDAPGQGGHVVLKDGEEIPYHVLVLATGMSWNGIVNIGDSHQEIRSNVERWRGKIAEASDIVIAGGGAVGIELAGEIKDIYPTKSITIVHNDRLLLNSSYPDRYREDIEKRVRGRGVDVIFWDKVDTPVEGTVGVTTHNGKHLPKADLVVPAFGSRPNTGFIASLGSDILTSKGFVKIKPTFELPDHPGVFALGDIINWNEQKQAGKITLGHGPIASANILNYLAGTPQKKVYKGSYETIVIPVGKEYGSGYFGFLWGLIFGNWFARMIKGRDLLVSATRAGMGYTN